MLLYLSSCDPQCKCLLHLLQSLAYPCILHLKVFPVSLLMCSLHANSLVSIIQTIWGAGKGGEVFSLVDKDKIMVD